MGPNSLPQISPTRVAMKRGNCDPPYAKTRVVSPRQQDLDEVAAQVEHYRKRAHDLGEDKNRLLQQVCCLQVELQTARKEKEAELDVLMNEESKRVKLLSQEVAQLKQDKRAADVEWRLAQKKRNKLTSSLGDIIDANTVRSFQDAEVETNDAEANPTHTQVQTVEQGVQTDSGEPAANGSVSGSPRAEDLSATPVLQAQASGPEAASTCRFIRLLEAHAFRLSQASESDKAFKEMLGTSQTSVERETTVVEQRDDSEERMRAVKLVIRFPERLISCPSSQDGSTVTSQPNQISSDPPSPVIDSAGKPTTPPLAVPDNAPSWLEPAFNFLNINAAPQYNALLGYWVETEAVMKTERGFSALPAWGKSWVGLKMEKRFMNESNPVMSREFALSFPDKVWSWWFKLQPKWRGSPVNKRLLIKGMENKNWSTLNHRGRKGWIIILVSLKWWWESIQVLEDNEKQAAKDDWLLAVEEMTATFCLARSLPRT
ncbi:hypothetical protein AAF712_007978 [Marasmius tenuissimus]|uniref:Uncharacterized protein n=1 Tax=Marasmius tenuissimus TaxID=585030 RepID=A0ABR2ZV96_9AGAR